eukprot:CAMPEP_0119106442 /NCGR_PEP_ID=MMETSP1180-20130426/4319_1 /TAXON_ID=3052 ORGANISM="Chlamydomonas cf sp, Strain CCMP681" /NCGR_SAMPLE_ID=MMETSP1180 /ASSEMBLY_ACC=CAM_ASM_000741 /LENGTH=126 /DNA_ID=CAMNT_0007091775 /DNA_START=51 /DNA_END=431 /DNA_ORIENTATION=+
MGSGEMEDVERSTQPVPKIGRFRAVARMVASLRRWTQALNPTVPFGFKNHDETPKPDLFGRGPSGRTMSVPGRSMSIPRTGHTAYVPTGQPRSMSGRPATNVGTRHGYKGNLLFAKLPHAEKGITT